MVDHRWSWCNSVNNFNSINVGETIMETVKRYIEMAKANKKIVMAAVVVIIIIIALIK